MVESGTDTFNFFLPVEALSKSDDKDKDGKRWVQGIASTDDKDLQDERVSQSGIDFSYFLTHGFINDDHKPGPENKVGEPTEARVTKAGLWIKGFLYKGHSRADYWWEFLNALDQSGSSRKVGFSIQGKVTRREGKSILKCWLQDIAITASPVNTKTWAEIVKSLNGERWCKHPWKSLEKACIGCAGNCRREDDEEKALSASGMGRALTPQSLEGRTTTITRKAIPEGHISYDQAVAEIMSRGYSQRTAMAMATTIFKSIENEPQLDGESVGKTNRR